MTVFIDELVWKTGISTGDKDQGINSLKINGILAV